MSSKNVPADYFLYSARALRLAGALQGSVQFRGSRRLEPRKLKTGTNQPALIDYFAVPTRSSSGDAMNSKPSLTAELVAEFLGTFVLILFGTGVVAMVMLFPTKNPGETIHGGFTNITLGWGLAVTMGVYIAGKISGAHLNPAITLAVAVFR